MKRKLPTRQERNHQGREVDSQNETPFFSRRQHNAFFHTSATEAFFQPTTTSASTSQPISAAGPSSPPAPYYISFTHVAPPASPDHSQPNPGPFGNAANRAGFTRISHKPSLTIMWESTPTPNAQGQVGLFVRSANVGFNVHTLLVAVSSDYPRGSCPYQVTYAHEYRHAYNFLRIFREHRTTMVQKAKGIPLPTAQNPHYVDPTQVDTTQEQLAAPLAQAIREVKTQITADMNADRNAMDSPTAYAQEYAQCPSLDW